MSRSCDLPSLNAPQRGGSGRASAGPNGVGRSQWVALLLLISGCGSSPAPKAEPKKDEKKEESPFADKTINVGKGEGTFRSDDAKRDPLWRVEWETSQVQGDGGQAVARTVKGQLFTNGKASTDFEADGARIDQKAKTLVLRGNVKVISKLEGGQPVTLTCETVRYQAEDKKWKIGVMKAQGKVRVVGDNGTIGPTPELWATSDMNVVATPNMFEAR